MFRLPRYILGDAIILALICVIALIAINAEAQRPRLLAPQVHFELYRSTTDATKAQDWRWRMVANNNRIIADSGEGYKNREDCLSAIAIVRTCRNASIVEKIPPIKATK